jgi:hypothetical protein
MLTFRQPRNKNSAMTINEYMTEFAGRKIVDYTEGLLIPTRSILRLGLSRTEDFSASWAHFLKEPKVNEAEGIVIADQRGAGALDLPAITEALIAAKDILKQLKYLFLGDVIDVECQMSWIKQGDVSPLLGAYPRLLHFGVRGGEGLAFSKIEHSNLRTLVVQTGGLHPKTIKEIGELSLPALEHLELWLGHPYYGGKARPEDLKRILSAKHYPALQRLGLRNSMSADEICKALLGAKVLEKISYLDLSLGALSDKGARCLVQNERLKKLEALDLHHHFISEKMQNKLKRALPNVAINLQDEQVPDEMADMPPRYCAVAE